VRAGPLILLFVPLWLALGCGGGQPQCFECGLNEEWARAEREEAARAEQEAARAEREGDAPGAPCVGPACSEAGESGARPLGPEGPGSPNADGQGQSAQCVPIRHCPDGQADDPCGQLGCPGATRRCGCQRGLACLRGTCVPRRQPCDPINVCPRPVREGGQCGRRSAGCPGATMTCRCDSGLSCVDGVCR